jgi:ABC-type transport system substrate-binding protein
MTPSLRRRRLLARLCLLGASAVAGPTLLAACQAPAPAAAPTSPPAKPTTAPAAPPPTTAPAKPTTAPAAAPTQAPAAAPTSAPAAAGRTGGELRIDALSEPTNGLDPLRFNAAEGQRIYRQTNSQLLKYREDKSFEGDLAAELPQVSPDRLTYTFKLRSGVKWHDGKPFDSADVKYTFDQIMIRDNQSVWLAAVGFVESVAAPDPQTFVLKLRSAFTPIMHKFAMIPIISSKVPYESNKTYAATAMGTGPFKFVEYVRGDRITLEKNPDYFIAGKPALDRITIRLVPENSTRITNLRNGTTQLLSDAPASQAEVIKQTGANLVVLENSATRYYAYPMLKEGEPTANVELRRAISWAIDRQGMVDQVLGGQGVPAATYLSSGSQYFDGMLGLAFGTKPDLEKARSFLQKAGGPPSRPLAIVVQNLPDLVDCVTILQQNLKAVGIESTIQAEEAAAFLPKLTGNTGYDLLIIRGPVPQAAGYGPDYPYLGLLSTSPTNFNKVNDPKMDDLVKKAVSAPEGAEAQAAWRAVQEYDVETLPNIQFVTARNLEAFSKNLIYTPSSLMQLNNLVDARLAA